MRSKKTPKHQRRTHWTDEAKQALFADFDAATNGGERGKAQVWLKAHHMSSSHFYRMRKQFKGGSTPAPAPAPAPTEPRTKHRISAEGRAAIVAAQKVRWAKAKKEGTGVHTANSTALVPTNGTRRKIITPAQLAEYSNLESGKAEWLKARGLNYQNIFDARRRNYPQPQVAQAQVLPTAAPGPVVTLDDAIAAMQVRQDLFQEFLDQLKRMQRVGR